MGRQKEFEPQLAVEKAMYPFWQKGFSATSIDDLVEATGVQRYGLYAAFRDKHGLFLAVIDHYLERMVGQMVHVLEQEEAGWTEIQAFFNQILSIAATTVGHNGCLMCNAANEMGQDDAEIANKMRRYQERLITLFERALIQAKATNNVGPNLDPTVGATFLFTTAVSLFALIKSPLPQATYAQHVTVALSGLQALSNS